MTKEEWKARAEWFNGLLEAGGFASADDYYWTRDEYRKAVAKSIGTTEVALDPMGFWFGSQSN